MGQVGSPYFIKFQHLGFHPAYQPFVVLRCQRAGTQTTSSCVCIGKVTRRQIWAVQCMIKNVSFELMQQDLLLVESYKGE